MATPAAENTNPYSAPQSELTEDAPQNQTLSISEALSRGYDFSIGDVLSEAWSKVSGSKFTIIAAIFIVFGISIGLSLITGLIAETLAKVSFVASVIIQLILQIISTAILYPFMAGLYAIAIHRADNHPIRLGLIFNYFNNVLPLLLSSVIISLIIGLPVALLLGITFALVSTGLPGKLFILSGVIAAIYVLYLSVSYIFVIPLITERGLPIWQALEVSRKAVNQRWLKIFALLVVIYIFIGLGALCLLIGLIWTVPLALIALGVLYRTIFSAHQ